jgi:basic membrane protein A and related proteins
MKAWRSSRLVALVAAFGLFAAACNGDDVTPPDPNGEAQPGEDLRVGLVFDIGGRGDQSFNDAAARGLDQAEADFGVDTRDLEPAGGGEDREELLRLLAEEEFDLIFGIGFAFFDSIDAVADEFPDLTFAIVDSVVERPNVASLTFAEHEGSFLVGAAAAMKSETGHIGFIGGVEIDLIEKFEAGYVAGAQHVNPDIEIDISYISQPPDFSGFADPARGREVALAQYEAGADVVYHAAGGSGAGLFEAAAETSEATGSHVWAIGVDSDQYLTAPAELQDYILTSMLKRVDVAVYETIADYVEGQVQGGDRTIGLSTHGVG